LKKDLPNLRIFNQIKLKYKERDVCSILSKWDS